MSGDAAREIANAIVTPISEPHLQLSYMFATRVKVLTTTKEQQAAIITHLEDIGRSDIPDAPRTSQTHPGYTNSRIFTRKTLCIGREPTKFLWRDNNVDIAVKAFTAIKKYTAVVKG